jgi:hypothetical protein
VNSIQEHSLPAIEKPHEGEYTAYVHIYIDLLPDDGQTLKHLADGFIAIRQLILSLPKNLLLHGYSEGKWTIKEILGKLADDECIYVYRALRFVRNDSTQLPGFDQENFARYSEVNWREAGDLLDELGLVRQSTIAFFKSLDPAVLLRMGVADGKRASLRARLNALHEATTEIRNFQKNQR